MSLRTGEFFIYTQRGSADLMEKREKTAKRMTKRQRRRRQRRRRILAAVMLSVVLLGFSAYFVLGQDKGEMSSWTEQTDTESLKGINSRNAILEELKTGKILADKGADDRIYPASLTKIMTAVLAIENIPDLKESITVPESIFPGLYAEGASMAGFCPGEEAVGTDLLYGVLLPSGAECCLAFADRIAGSEEDFVKMMNDKAGELGMEHTHFTNSTGLQDKNHYSTVRDISVLLRYALESDTFRRVFTSSSHSTNPSACHPDGFTFVSTMFREMNSAAVSGGEILGGKTGYTKDAGLCLASLAVIDGKEYILVTAHARGDHETKQYHVEDAVKIYSQIGK